LSTTIYSPNDSELQAIHDPAIPVSFYKNKWDSGVKRTLWLKDSARPYWMRRWTTVEIADIDTERPDLAAFQFNETISWSLFAAYMAEESHKEYPDKWSAPLFSPTTYRPIIRSNRKGGVCYGFRLTENAEMTGLVVIDADEGMAFGEAVTRLEGFESVIYTTASNKDVTRWRAVLPLLELVDQDEQARAVAAVCRHLKIGWQPDTGKMNAHSLFYTPGAYAGAQNEFIYQPGEIFSASDWLDAYPEPPQPVRERTEHFDNSGEDSRAKAEAALAVMENHDYSYDEWLKIAYAAKAADVDPYAFEQWSAKSSKHNQKIDTYRFFASLRPPRAISAETLFYYADQDDPEHKWRKPFGRAYYERKRAERNAKWREQMLTWNKFD
jgi:Primase C terminal 2 (PriCT-2)